jgi:CBS domain-containing protein
MRIGDLAHRHVVSVNPSDTLRRAAQAMTDAKIGMVLVLDGDDLVGVLSERDILRTVAESADPDTTPVSEAMTRDVVTVAPDWEVYEAAAEMAARNFRHLVVTDDEENGGLLGVVSVRDVLLAGQRIELAHGSWAVLRDSLTFSVRERRKLQRYLLELRDDTDMEDSTLVDLLGLLVGTWSLDVPLPPDADALHALDPADFAAQREAVLAEIPELDRAVHPAPGWRRRDTRGSR